MLIQAVNKFCVGKLRPGDNKHKDRETMEYEGNDTPSEYKWTSRQLLLCYLLLLT